jgi:hypothetical protein
MGRLGGSSNKAQKQADAENQQQQQDIQNSISGINSIFDDPSRQAQYDQLAADTTKYLTNDVNDQQAIAQRQDKFALARRGLVGGSQQAVEGAQLDKDYNSALLKASQAGQSASANLQQQDEQSRMNLISQAEAGLTAGDAASNATSQLASNLQSGQSTANANTIAGAFGDLANTYTASQNQKALNAGTLYGYSGLFGGQGAPAGAFG